MIIYLTTECTDVTTDFVCRGLLATTTSRDSMRQWTATALTETGVVLVSAMVSGEAEARQLLTDRRSNYLAYCGEECELVWVPLIERDSHHGLQQAVELLKATVVGAI